MSEENAGGRRFNSATDAEIRNADVADSYFHRTMQILRARGLEDTPVHAELAYKTSDPDAWFVVAGLDEVAYLLDGVDVDARAVPEGTICRPHEPVLTLSGPYGAFASTRPRYSACSARPRAWPRGPPAAGSPPVRSLLSLLARAGCIPPSPL